ncbi:MAG: MBL fold metallo-hydrolase [Coriobacteriia bacterium]|nr:MBL fold metallo-hydrolase [Coriobacteriia bacterium]
MGTHTFTFMGTGAGCGVPAFFCDCPACTEARQNPRARRGDCGIMIRGEKTTLIDTPPDCRHQLIREGVRAVDNVLFTHCHSDHVGGLLELEYMVALKTKQNLPVWGTEDTLAGIMGEFEFMCYCLDFHGLEPFGSCEFDGVRYTALPVQHCAGSVGYLIETDRSRTFYAPDTAKLLPETAERIQGIDALAMDATYWKHCPTPNTHHSVQECIEEGLSLGVKTVYLTHLCMHYYEPVTLVELEEFCKQYDGRVVPAADGLSFEI